MNKIPPDAKLAIEAVPEVKEKWDSLTAVGQHDFISWLKSAKQAETRARRVEKMCDMLAKGKRRPCCFSVVPLSLHKALKANPVAKTKWSSLAPSEKRVFLDWIGDGSGVDGKARVEKACKLIAEGKKTIK